MVGLPVTGILDRKTIKKMQAPRCGNKDIFRDNDRKGKKKKGNKKNKNKEDKSSKLELKPEEYKTLGRIQSRNNIQ
jgi:hypothetical protein